MISSALKDVRRRLRPSRRTAALLCRDFMRGTNRQAAVLSSNQKWHSSRELPESMPLLAFFSIGSAVASATAYSQSDDIVTRCETLAVQMSKKEKLEAKDFPIISRDEVSKHTTQDSRIWVTYKDGVYDITDFIVNHPGGMDKIMLAAGRAIDPFWRVYQQHINRGNAVKVLEDLRIGSLDPADVPPVVEGDDPYASDPERHPGLLFHNTKPCNAELPVQLMMDSWVTPNDLWFIRHHHPVPHMDVEKYRLSVGGIGCKPILLDMEDIRTRFTKNTVTCTIQCGGNRRSGLDKIEKTSGIGWGIGAMSTATFSGVWLRDILRYSGLMTPDSAARDGVEHVIFEAVDNLQASIPIEKALSSYGDVLLAYEMNGENLPPEHGFPLRVVVPGHVGIRNVKWVSKIETSAEEAVGPWQRGIAYKGFSPSLKTLSDFGGEEAIAKVLSMQELPVTSAIVEPKEGAKVELDDVNVKGFAWAGGGRGIARVDVSIDGGKLWHTAELKEGSEQHSRRAWAWTFWECDIEIPEEMKNQPIQICCKATDASYNSQPENPEHIWNLRGLANNSWHVVSITHSDE